MLLTIGIIAYAISMIATFVCLSKKNPSSIFLIVVIAGGVLAMICIGKEFLFPSPQTASTLNSISAPVEVHPVSVADTASENSDYQNSSSEFNANNTTTNPSSSIDYSNKNEFTYTGESGFTRDELEKIYNQFGVTEAYILACRDFVQSIFPSNSGWVCDRVGSDSEPAGYYMVPIGRDSDYFYEMQTDLAAYGTTESYNNVWKNVEYIELYFNSEGNTYGWIHMHVGPEGRIIAQYNIYDLSTGINYDGVGVRLA